jgi:hypothetical protein
LFHPFGFGFEQVILQTLQTPASARQAAEGADTPNPLFPQKL